MNLSTIPGNTLAGRILRTPLRLIPKETVVPVLQGPLRGARWITGSANHGCWFGSYEASNQHLLTTLVRQGDITYDVGANVGFYSLLMSRLTGLSGKVYSFEPSPRNIAYLRRHLMLNGSDNVSVIAAAVADKTSTGWFREMDSPAVGRLDSYGDYGVQVVALDQLDLPPPALMKVDIEGAEYLLLQGAARLIEQHRPSMLIATHTPELRGLCCDFLRKRRYEITTLAHEDELLATPGVEGSVSRFDGKKEICEGKRWTVS